jgi:uncharacterized membrane protein YphA (DoxX/SURF4 family)
MVAAGVETALLLVARVLFGGVIAVTGLNHFLQTDAMTGYAQHEGLPLPRLSVLGSGALLVLGGVGIVVDAFPLVSGVAVAGFLVVSALLMHDFWAADAESRDDERTHFLKNVAMAGGALALAVLGTRPGVLGLGIGL